MDFLLAFIDNIIRLINCMNFVELGLDACADTMIGGHLIKGISGGERKRTSVGVELVVKPALVFLDEPTSGLDSYSAMKIINVLKKVAKAGSSVMFTIHQPSSDVFMSFDNLLLMNKGRIMSAVSAASTAEYFASRGHPVPLHFNPADWIMVRVFDFHSSNKVTTFFLFPVYRMSPKLSQRKNLKQRAFFQTKIKMLDPFLEGLKTQGMT